MNIAGTSEDLRATMLAIGGRACSAASGLALAPTAKKNAALLEMAGEIRRDAALIAAENAADLTAARARDLKASFIDRLTLTSERIEAMAKGLEEIATLPDPVGTLITEWTR